MTEYITNAASQAYNNAPDLGVSSTLQAAYDKLPAIRSGNGNGDASAEGESNHVGGGGEDGSDRPEDVSSNADPNATSGAQRLQTHHEQLLKRSEESGPSSEDRMGKSQTAVGIEDEIPTAAGKGTTLPQDETVQKAADGAKRKEAHVPEDYQDVSCPSKEIRGEAPTQNGNSGSAEEGGAANGDAATGTKEDADSNSSSNSGKRSLGQKIKDSVKGEIKVIKGTVKKDQEVKDQGKALKKGDSA